MNPLVRLVRSLGNEGAVANAGAVVEARRREDWLVDALERRLDGRTLPPPAAATTAA